MVASVSSNPDQVVAQKENFCATLYKATIQKIINLVKVILYYVSCYQWCKPEPLEGRVGSPPTTASGMPPATTPPTNNISEVLFAALTQFPTDRNLRNKTIAPGGILSETGRSTNLDTLIREAEALGAHIPCAFNFDLSEKTIARQGNNTDLSQIPSHRTVCEEGCNRSQGLLFQLLKREVSTIEPYGATGGPIPFLVPTKDEYVENPQKFNLLQYFVPATSLPNEGKFFTGKTRIYRFGENNWIFPLSSSSGILPADKDYRGDVIDKWNQERTRLIDEYFGTLVNEGGVIYTFNKSFQVVLLGLLEAAEELDTDLSKVHIIPIESADPVVGDDVEEQCESFLACCEKMLDQLGVNPKTA